MSPRSNLSCARDPRAVSAAGTGSLTLMYDDAARERGFSLRSTGTGSRPVLDRDRMLLIGTGVKNAADKEADAATPLGMSPGSIDSLLTSPIQRELRSRVRKRTVTIGKRDHREHEPASDKDGYAGIS